MIDKRYRATIKTELGNEWLVDIRPADSPSGAPSPATFQTLAGGFELQYAGNGEDFTTPIRGSEATVVMVVQNQDDADFALDIASEQDQTYCIELLRKNETGGLYTSWWTGYIWPDKVQISFASFPYSVKLQASDSIARNKNYDGFTYSFTRVWGMFQQLFAAYSPGGSIVQDGNIVPPAAVTGAGQKLRLASTYVSGSSSPGETNLWYNLVTAYSTPHGLTIYTDYNRLTVLTDWLRNWGCRIFLEGGYYNITEFRYMQQGTIDWAEHDSQGIPTGTTTPEDITKIAGNTHRILDGGKLFFKQPYLRSYLEYIDATTLPVSKTTDFRPFDVPGSDERNVATMKPSFGDVWSYNLGHSTTGVAPITDVTGNIGNDTTSGPANLVEIFQDNMEWFYTLPQKYFNGSIRSKTLKFSSLLIIGTEKFVCNSATYTASEDVWTGEWVKVGELADNEWMNQNNDAIMMNQNNDANFKFQ